MTTTTTTTTRAACSRCGLLCEVAGWPRPLGPFLPAMARERDTGRAVCDPCVAVETIATLERDGIAYGYIADDGATLTTWGGSHIARVTMEHATRSGFGRGMVAWRAVTPNGVRLHGRGAGRNMSTIMHRSR